MLECFILTNQSLNIPHKRSYYPKAVALPTELMVQNSNSQVHNRVFYQHTSFTKFELNNTTRYNKVWPIKGSLLGHTMFIIILLMGDVGVEPTSMVYKTTVIKPIY